VTLNPSSAHEVTTVAIVRHHRPIASEASAAIGAVAGGYAGEGIAELIDLTTEHNWLRDYCSDGAIAPLLLASAEIEQNNKRKDTQCKATRPAPMRVISSLFLPAARPRGSRVRVLAVLKSCMLSPEPAFLGPAGLLAV